MLGTGIALPAQHDPIAYAKQIATLDRIACGRFVLGIGYGWNEDEMENHGVDPRRRAHVREAMLAMQALWSKEVAGYQGEFVRCTPSYQWPKPVQQPRPRVLLGGTCIKQALPELRRLLAERGRDPAALHVVPMGVFPDAAKLAYYAESGVTECVLRLPSAPRDAVLPVLDAYARLPMTGIV